MSSNNKNKTRDLEVANVPSPKSNNQRTVISDKMSNMKKKGKQGQSEEQFFKESARLHAQDEQRDKFNSKINAIRNTDHGNFSDKNHKGAGSIEAYTMGPSETKFPLSDPLQNRINSSPMGSDERVAAQQYKMSQSDARRAYRTARRRGDDEGAQRIRQNAAASGVTFGGIKQYGEANRVASSTMNHEAEQVSELQKLRDQLKSTLDDSSKDGDKSGDDGSSASYSAPPGMQVPAQQVSQPLQFAPTTAQVAGTTIDATSHGVNPSHNQMNRFSFLPNALKMAQRRTGLGGNRYA